MPTRRRKQFYAVVKGMEPNDTGIYDNWLVAEPVVKHASGSCFKGYESLKEAVEHMRQAGIRDPIVFTRDQNGVTSQMSVGRYIAAGCKREGMSFLSSPRSDPVDDGEDSIILSPELTELTIVSRPLHVTSTPVSAADPQTDTIRKSLYSNITSPKLPSAPSESLTGDRSPLIPSAPPEPQLSPVVARTPLPLVKPKTPTAPNEPILVNEAPDMMPNNCVGTQTDASLENDLYDELQSLKKQLNQCKSEKKSLLSEKDNIVRKNVKLEEEKESLSKMVEELEALAIANDFPTAEPASQSYISEVTITLQNNAAPQVPIARCAVCGLYGVCNVVCVGGITSWLDSHLPPMGKTLKLADSYVNHKGISSWMKKQLAPMGQYPKVPKPSKQEKAKLSVLEQLPFFHEDAVLIPDNTSFIQSDYTPVPLHDPSLPPVLFKLDSAYPELSNLYHIPGRLKLWGQKFRSKEHGYVWKKAKYHGDDPLADRVLHTRSAKKVMYLGRANIYPCDEWETSVKFEAMHELQIAALEQCDRFRESLLDTGMRPLKEDTDHHTWGHLKGGQNELGHMYEELRRSLAMQETQDNEARNDMEETIAPSEQPHYPLNPDAPSFVSGTVDSTKAGLIFGDSNSQGVHPRCNNLVFRTVPVPGGTVCPTPQQKCAADLLPTAMCGDEAAISLHFGVNDAGNCDPVEFKEHYRKLVRVAKSKGADVICSNIYHRADSPTMAECISLNTHIDVLNEQIKSVAFEEGATYLDNVKSVESTATDPNINILTTPRYGVKYLHLTPAARIDLGQRIAAEVDGEPLISMIPSRRIRYEPPQHRPPSQMNRHRPIPPTYHSLYSQMPAAHPMGSHEMNPKPGSQGYLESCTQYVSNWFDQSYPRRNRYWSIQ